MNESDWYGERVIRVHLPCNWDLVAESNVEILNIEEDIQGRDVLTFTCPACGQAHKSWRIG